MDSSVVPFALAGGTHGGLGECFGIVRWDGDRLVLEYQVYGFLRILKAGTRTLRIRLEDLEAVTWRKRLPGGRLELRFRTMTAAGDLPLRDGELILRVKRRHRAAASDIALQYELLCSGHRHRRSHEPPEIE